MIRRRCKWHTRGIGGGLIRCELARGHVGDHVARLGLSPIVWPAGVQRPDGSDQQ